MLKIFFAVMVGWMAALGVAEAKPMTLTFADHVYIHRWSKANQNEFTPADQPDLNKWRDMVTLNLHPDVKDGDRLAELANAVLGNYQRSGKVIRTDSRPRTDKKPAEHLIVAVLGAPGVVEAAFARLVLVDDVAVIAVYSHRAYGADAAKTMSAWLEANGPATEKALMDWKGIPKPASLRALPQSK